MMNAMKKKEIIIVANFLIFILVFSMGLNLRSSTS